MKDWDKDMDVFYFLVNGVLWCFERPIPQQKRFVSYALKDKEKGN